MKVYKKRLPEGVRKQFALEKGIKVKVLNSLYYDKKKKNTELSNFKESVKIINCKGHQIRLKVKSKKKNLQKFPKKQVILLIRLKNICPMKLLNNWWKENSNLIMDTLFIKLKNH